MKSKSVNFSASNAKRSVKFASVNENSLHVAFDNNDCLFTFWANSEWSCERYTGLFAIRHVYSPAFYSLMWMHLKNYLFLHIISVAIQGFIITMYQFTYATAVYIFVQIFQKLVDPRSSRNCPLLSTTIRWLIMFSSYQLFVNVGLGTFCAVRKHITVHASHVDVRLNGAFNVLLVMAIFNWLNRKINFS